MEKEAYANFIQDGAFDYKAYMTFGKRYFAAVAILVVAILFFAIVTIQSTFNIYNEIHATLGPVASIVYASIIGVLKDHEAEIVIILIIAILASYIASLLALDLLKLIGAAFIWLMTILVAVLSLFFLILATDYTSYAWLLVPLAFLPPVVLGFFWKHIRVASRLINMTADQVMRNKQIFGTALIFGLTCIALNIGMLGFYIDNFVSFSANSTPFLQFKTPDMHQFEFIAAVTFVYFFLAQVNYNFFYGAIVHHAHASYRNVQARPLDSMRVVNRRLPALIVYSLFSSIIYIIKWIFMKMAKKSRNVEKLASLGINIVVKKKLNVDGAKKETMAQRLANWAICMLEKMWMFINFFTLPAIIIENKSTIGAIKKSAKYVRSNIVDVFVKKSFIRFAFRFTTLVFILLCAGAGALVGLWFMNYFGMTPVTAMIAFSFSFCFFAGVPAWIMSKNLDAVYVTFLYCHLVDEDLHDAGVNLIPSKFFGTNGTGTDGTKKFTIEQKACAVIGALFAITAAGMLGYGLLTLIEGNVALASQPEMFLQWLREISYWDGIGAVGFLLALIFFKAGRTNHVVTALGINAILATLAAVYIYYLHPGVGALASFTIIAASLDCIALGGLFLGVLVEIYWLRQRSIMALNHETIEKMKRNALDGVMLKETIVEKPLVL